MRCYAMLLIANEFSLNDVSVLSQWWAEGFLVTWLAYVGQSKEQAFNTSPISHDTSPGLAQAMWNPDSFMQIEQNYTVVSGKTVSDSKSLLVSAVWSSWNQGNSSHVHFKRCIDAMPNQTVGEANVNALK